jgi:hypothetical protein
VAASSNNLAGALPRFWIVTWCSAKNRPDEVCGSSSIARSRKTPISSVPCSSAVVAGCSPESALTVRGILPGAVSDLRGGAKRSRIIVGPGVEVGTGRFHRGPPGSGPQYLDRDSVDDTADVADARLVFCFRTWLDSEDARAEGYCDSVAIAGWTALALVRPC